jgi:hypothetical protein
MELNGLEPSACLSAISRHRGHSLGGCLQTELISFRPRRIDHTTRLGNAGPSSSGISQRAASFSSTVNLLKLMSESPVN